jgi:phosphonopyruvate decarboxylase
VALVVRKDTFAKYKSQSDKAEIYKLSRESALGEILKLCHAEDLIVSTTGKTSREIFELRGLNGQMQRDFLTVGGMGHTSSIALGVAIGQPNRRVICIDGDGSLLMHMGSMPVIAKFRPINFIHIILNNCSHESVGGQPTAAEVIDFSALAQGVGYAGFATVNNLEDLRSAWKKFDSSQGPLLLEIKIKNGSRSDLGRPTTTAEQNKKSFMKFAGV